MAKPCAVLYRNSKSDINIPQITELKEYLNKEYRLVKNVKYDKFLRKMGADEGAVFKAMNARPTVVLRKCGDEYTLTTKYPDGSHKRVKFKIGKLILREKPDGNTIRSTFEVTRNKLIEKQEYEDKMVIIAREYTKNDLLVSMEVNDVTCFRYYKLLVSWHSIGTETSRRNSLFQRPSEAEVVPSPTVQSVIQDIQNSDSNSDEESTCW